MKSFTIPVEQDPDSEDCYLTFPEELLKEAGWKIGDKLTWKDNHDGSFILEKKKDTQWVLVEAVSTFRMRYMVETPVNKSDWALDAVTMQEAKEFSQHHMGEQIVSHRVLTMDEALRVCDRDNDYTKSWTDQQKISAFFTTEEDQHNTDFSYEDPDYENPDQ